MRWALAALLLLATPAAAQEWTAIPGTKFVDAERTQMQLGLIDCANDPVCAAIVDPSKRMQAASVLGARWCSELDGCPGGHFSWTGSVYDPQTRMILHLRQEGHHDGRGADSQCIDLDDAAPHWIECEPPKHMTLLTGQTKNGQPICNFPPDGAPSMHGYDGSSALGGGRYLVFGNDPGCKSDVGKPSKLAFLVDTNVVVNGSFKWTRQPQLDAYSGQTATAVYQGKVYVLEMSGKWIVLGAATLADLGHGQLKAITGKTGFRALNSQMSAGDINDQGIFAAGNANGIALMDVAAFGKNVLHPIATGSGFIGNVAAIAAVPGGRFALWNGNKEIWIVKFDFLNPANDVWTKYAPATGPTRQNPYTLSRLFWDAQLGALVGYSNRSENIWVFRVPG